MKFKASTICMLLIVSLCAQAQTAEIARCGASTGKAYYPVQGVVAPGKGGWVDDGISNGSLTLVRLANGLLDMSHGAAGGGMTARQDLAELQVVRHTPTEVAVLVVYPLSVETYLFTLDDGKPVVVWTRNKGTQALAAAVSVFVASCDFIDFQNVAP